MPFIRSPFHSPAASPSIQLGSPVLDPETGLGRPPLIRDILRSPQLLPNLPCLLKDKVCGVSSSVLGVIRKHLGDFLKKTDAVQAVSQYQNREYLEMEAQTCNLLAFKEQIDSLIHNIQAMPSLCDSKKAELVQWSSKLLQAIDRLSVSGRQWWKMSLFALSSIGLCILPLLIANKRQDYQYLSLLVAGYVKTMVIVVGLLRNTTSDWGSFLLHYKERHIPYLIPSIPYAFATYNKQVKHLEENHVWPFIGLSALFTGTLFFATSAPQLFYKPVAGIFNRVKRLASGVESPILQQQLADDVNHAVRALFESVRQEMNAFLERKADFEKTGHALSDVLSTQTIDIQESYRGLEEALSDLLGVKHENSASAVNTDRNAKLIFAMLAAIMCVGAAATYYDEPMGLVDLGTDSALTVGEMLKTTFNAAETTQRAAEKFSSYSGLSPFLLPFGVLNTIKATHFTDSIAGLVTGIVLLTGANLLLPRVTSEALTGLVLRQFQSKK